MINGKRILNGALRKIISDIEERRIGVPYVLERGLEELNAGLESVEFDNYIIHWFLNFEESLFKYEQLLDEIGHVAEEYKDLVFIYQSKLEEFAQEFNNLLEGKYEIEKTLREKGPNCNRDNYCTDSDGLKRIKDPSRRFGSEVGTWTI